jgi:hypothetical protein
MKTARHRTVVREFEHAERVMEKKASRRSLAGVAGNAPINSTSRTMNTSRACANG